MKKSIVSTMLVVGLAGCSTIQNTGHELDTSMFPSIDGYQKIILAENPHRVDGTLVGITAIKEVVADCNTLSLNGEIVEKNLEGWGYPYFQVEVSSQPAPMTKMMCPEPAAPKKLQIGNELILKYNSKLPVVVYYPEGVDVDFAIYEKNHI